MKRAVLQSALISQMAENEMFKEACLVIQDLSSARGGLKNAGLKIETFPK